MQRAITFCWVLAGVGLGMLFGAMLVGSSQELAHPVLWVGILFVLLGGMFAEFGNLLRRWAAKRAEKKAAAAVAAATAATAAPAIADAPAQAAS